MMGHEKPITNVDEMAKDIANQLVCSELTPIRAPIGVSVIVDLNKLHQTTDFGRLLSEDLISQLQRKNMAVIDIKAQNFMLINPKGEFYLSRNINNLRKEYKIGYVLVGTYSVGNYSTSVNVKMIDASNGFSDSHCTCFYTYTNNERFTLQLLPILARVTDKRFFNGTFLPKCSSSNECASTNYFRSKAFF